MPRELEKINLKVQRNCAITEKNFIISFISRWTKFALDIWLVFLAVMSFTKIFKTVTNWPTLQTDRACGKIQPECVQNIPNLYILVFVEYLHSVGFCWSSSWVNNRFEVYIGWRVTFLMCSLIRIVLVLQIFNNRPYGCWSETSCAVRHHYGSSQSCCMISYREK